MSEYVDIKTEFRSLPALVAALQETGRWTPGQILLCPDGLRLLDYRGNERPDVAHVRINRRWVGPAANDIGFRRETDGTYTAIISRHERRPGAYDENWLCRLRRNYAFHAIRMNQEQRGRRVERQELPNGRQLVTVHGY